MSLLKAMLMGEQAPIQDSFKVITYQGTGTERSITGVGFQPDFVWIKTRSVEQDHFLLDSIRGASKYLRSNLTAAEGTLTTGLVSFDADGFTLGTNAAFNGAGTTFVAWCWKADNTSGSSNTDGSITSTVSANTKAGFSIVKYTGTGAVATIGHGLNAVPKLILFKQLDDATARNWIVYSENGINDPYYAFLNTTNAFANDSSLWNDTPATASVVTLGTNVNHNNSGINYIAYCFAEIPKLSSIGSYTGNGSTTGPVIDCGFQPAYLMVKRTDAVGSWLIKDNKRDPHNPNRPRLWADLSNAESDGYSIDFTATGFQLKTTSGDCNASGGEYIYMAFAELPQESSPENSDEPLFNTIAYTGDGTDYNALDGLGFKPDLVWLKSRSEALSHGLFDIIRGVGNYLSSDNNLAEGSVNGLISFDADGLTLDDNVTWNTNASTNVAWCWNAGGEPKPNLDGSIPSTVMTNTEGGFSIVKYTGTGANATIGHGLDAAPDIIIVKDLDSVNSWRVYSSNIPNTQHLILNTTDTLLTGTHWNDTTATDSVFSLGVNSSVNGSGNEFIAYCWTSKSGKSDFGSYTGDGSVSGNEIDCGFRPDFIMIKRTDVVNSWIMQDRKRDPTNPNTIRLWANEAIAEVDGSYDIDFVSTGFELLNASNAVNALNGEYIYMAFKANDDPAPLHQVETGNLLLSDSLEDDNGTHTITVLGDTQLSTVEVACGVNSILLDGSGDALITHSHSDFSFADGDFTLDCFINPSSISSHTSIMHQFLGTTGWAWNFDSDSLNFYYSSVGLITGNVILTINEWQHIAVVRHGSLMLIYHNGILLSSSFYTVTTNGNTGTPFGIGNATGLTNLSGYLDHVRITKGTALWNTTNFNLSDKGLYYPSGTLQI